MPADLVAVVVAEAEPAERAGSRVAAGIDALDLEPDGLAEPPPPQLLLDRQQEVVRLVLLERRGRRCG